MKMPVSGSCSVDFSLGLKARRSAFLALMLGDYRRTDGPNPEMKLTLEGYRGKRASRNRTLSACSLGVRPWVSTHSVSLRNSTSCVSVSAFASTLNTFAPAIPIFSVRSLFRNARRPNAAASYSDPALTSTLWRRLSASVKETIQTREVTIESIAKKRRIPYFGTSFRDGARKTRLLAFDLSNNKRGGCDATVFATAVAFDTPFAASPPFECCPIRAFRRR